MLYVKILKGAIAHREILILYELYFMLYQIESIYTKFTYRELSASFAGNKKIKIIGKTKEEL